jgi:flagellin-like hook-associated protein FlgL
VVKGTSAADDAAGMAIRELMRSDIAVLNQGIETPPTPSA